MMLRIGVKISISDTCLEDVALLLIAEHGFLYDIMLMNMYVLVNLFAKIDAFKIIQI